MNVERTAISDLSEDVLAKLHRGPFMSSPGFARLWEVVGGRAVAWVASQAGNVVAALVGVEFGRAGLTRFQAMPDGCFATLYTEPATDRGVSATEAILHAITRAGYLRSYVTDFDHSLGTIAELSRQPCRTMLVDVSAEDWEPPDAKLRSEIRKAEREGVGVVTFDHRVHGDGFWKLVQCTESRHGRRPKYPYKFFEALAHLAGDDDRVIWLFVEHEGAAVASHIYFIQGDQLMHWQGYFDKRFSALKAGQLIMSQAVRQAQRRGVTSLNMGASPDNAPDLVAYKQKWGGRAYEYAALVHRSWLGRLL